MRKTRKELLAEGWIERKHYWFKRGEFGTTILSKKYTGEKNKEPKEKITHMNVLKITGNNLLQCCRSMLND